MRFLAAILTVFLLFAGVPVSEAGGADEMRLLVLPFRTAGDSGETELHRNAIPAMIEACFSRMNGIAIVDRGRLESILEEQALSLTGLTDENQEVQTGRLAGATILIGGHFNAAAESLLLSGRAVDIESGRVVSSVTVQGDEGAVFNLALEFCSSLAAGLAEADLPAFTGPFDAAPEGGLHFMRGLGYFYAARHERALVEFFQAAGNERWSSPARFWVARTYDALGEPANACLELQTLDMEDLPPSLTEDAGRLLAACRERVSRDESKLLELMFRNE